MLSEKESSIPEGRKTEIESRSRRKMDFMQREYWLARNGKQTYMRCPYCMVHTPAMNEPVYTRNFVDGDSVCCPLFARALEAILDRQEEVDTAASHVRNCHKVGLVN